MATPPQTGADVQRGGGGKFIVSGLSRVRRLGGGRGDARQCVASLELRAAGLADVVCRRGAARTRAYSHGFTANWRYP